MDVDTRGLARGLWRLAARRFSRAIPPWAIRRAFACAHAAVQANVSGHTNHEVFLDALGDRARVPREDLEQRYRGLIETDLPQLARVFTPRAGVREALLDARSMGLTLVLAPNPMWPRQAAELRLRRAGLADVPFALVCHSELMTRSKPSEAFYRELLDRLGVDSARCLMVGNDPVNDLPATGAGIRTCLVGRGTRRIEADGAGAAHAPSLAHVTDWLRRAPAQVA